MRIEIESYNVSQPLTSWHSMKMVIIVWGKWGQPICCPRSARLCCVSLTAVYMAHWLINSRIMSEESGIEGPKVNQIETLKLDLLGHGKPTLKLEEENKMLKMVL